MKIGKPQLFGLALAGIAGAVLLISVITGNGSSDKEIRQRIAVKPDPFVYWGIQIAPTTGWKRIDISGDQCIRFAIVHDLPGDQLAVLYYHPNYGWRSHPGGDVDGTSYKFRSISGKPEFFNVRIARKGSAVCRRMQRAG